MSDQINSHIHIYQNHHADINKAILKSVPSNRLSSFSIGKSIIKRRVKALRIYRYLHGIYTKVKGRVISREHRGLATIEHSTSHEVTHFLQRGPALAEPIGYTWRYISLDRTRVHTVDP